MTNTNYTPITEAQINASLGRDTFYGDPAKVRIHCDHKGILSISGEPITMSKAFDLIAADKVWGMNVLAEKVIRDSVKVIFSAKNELSSPSQGVNKDQEIKPINAPLSFNVRNFHNLVSDGSIFYVEFTKRSTGKLRKMKCRTGVKKHLKGGAKGYSAKAKGLLTVFDMELKGYRSIPVEAIERLTVGGQSFNFAGV